MNTHFQSALVVNFEHHIKGLTLPDPDDRHVVAAAMQARADQIVTCNLKHFPLRTLKQFGLEPMHPDVFAVQLFERSPDVVIQAMHKHRAGLLNPPVDVDEFLDVLSRQGLKRIVGLVRSFSEAPKRLDDYEVALKEFLK